MQSPPTLSEITQWPAALRHDVLYLVRTLGDIRTARGRARGKRGKGQRG